MSNLNWLIQVNQTIVSKRNLFNTGFYLENPWQSSGWDYAFTALSSILGRGTKILKAMLCSQNKQQNNNKRFYLTSLYVSWHISKLFPLFWGPKHLSRCICWWSLWMFHLYRPNSLLNFNFEQLNHRMHYSVFIKKHLKISKREWLCTFHFRGLLI